MNKNIFLYFLGLALVFAGCTKKQDDVFDKNPDERLTEALAGYQKTLVQAPGWKVFIYPQGLKKQGVEVGGMSYYMKFTDSNRVTMVSDFITTYATTPKESGYRLKAVQRPSIYFDTYSYIHVPADPNSAVSFSPSPNGNGYGWGTDFDFAFADNGPSDTIHLKGNFNSSEGVMIKATQVEMDSAFKKARLASIMNFTFAYPAANPFLYLQASTTVKASLGFDFNNVIITFSYFDAGGTLLSTKVPFSFTTTGIYLKTPITIGNYTFQEMFWDDVKKVYYILSGGTRVELANASGPSITLSLTNVIGSQYTTISVPPLPTTLPNRSTLFAQKYDAARTGMLNGPYGLTMDDMDFVFNSAAKTMSINLYAYQGAVGPFLLQYNYTYTVDATGLFKFTKTVPNANGNLVLANMNNILSYIESDQFQLTAFATSTGLLGQFTSKQTPTFFFTGYLY